MPQSLVKIWLHAVFSTKKRYPFIERKWERELYNHIHSKLEERNCPTRIVNGMPDHVHLLFMLSATQSIAATMGYVKGESSRWLNVNYFENDEFRWQDGYGAFSISEKNVLKVQSYIYRQKIIHQKRSFDEEWSLLKRDYVNGFIAE